MTIRRNLSAKRTRRAVEWRSPPTVLAGIDATIWVHYTVCSTHSMYIASLSSSSSSLKLLSARRAIRRPEKDALIETCMIYGFLAPSRSTTVAETRLDPSVHPPFLSRQLVRSLNARTWCIECTGSREFWCYLYCDCPSTKVMVPKDIRSRLHVLVFILFPT